VVQGSQFIVRGLPSAVANTMNCASFRSSTECRAGYGTPTLSIILVVRKNRQALCALTYSYLLPKINWFPPALSLLGSGRVHPQKGNSR
jgi:hypothetical protein